MPGANEKGDTKTYAALMDEHTCASCAARHGVKLAASDERHVIPNPYCTCKLGCRCCWVMTPEKKGGGSRGQ